MEPNDPTLPTQSTDQATPVVQAETLPPLQEHQITSGTAGDPPADPNQDTTILPALVDDPMADNLKLAPPPAPSAEPAQTDSLAEQAPQTTETASPSWSETSTEPSDDPSAQSEDDLGYPLGLIGRTITLAIAEKDPGGYAPGEIVVKLSPEAQLGLRRLAAGRAATDGSFVDYAGTVRTILEGFAQ